MHEVRLKIEDNRIVALIIDDIPLMLKKPIPLDHSSEVIMLAYKLSEFFDLKRTFYEISRYLKSLEKYSDITPSMIATIDRLYESLIKTLLKTKPRYLERKFVLNVLNVLLSKDLVSMEELVRESGILEEARKRGVKPGKFLAGVLGGLNRRSQRIGLGKIIEKTPDGKYYIPQHLRNVLSSYYNLLKQTSAPSLTNHLNRFSEKRL